MHPQIDWRTNTSAMWYVLVVAVYLFPRLNVSSQDQYRATREIPLPYWLEEDIDPEEARRI